MSKTDPYKNLIENSLELIQSVDRNGKFLFVNRIWNETMGYSEAEVHTLRFKDILSKDCADECLTVFASIVKGKTMESVHARFITKSGGTIEVKGTFVPRIVNGEVIAVQSILTDLTRQKERESSIRNTEERFRVLFESMKQGIVYQRPNGEIFLANPAACQILGLTEGQLLGRSSIDPRWHAIHPDGTPFPGEDHPAMVAGRTGKVVQNVRMGVHIPETAEYRWIIVTSIPEFHEGETVPYQVFTTFVDYTEQKQIQDVLQTRVDLERVLNAVSARFIASTEGTFDADVNMMLQQIGNVTGVDRTYLFEYDPTQTMVNNTHEWCREGVEPQIQNLQETPVAAFPVWDAMFKRNEFVHVDNIASMPPEQESERSILEPQGIQSVLLVPLFLAGKPIGFTGFDAVRKKVVWSEDDISILRTMAEILASTIERMRRDRELHEKHRQLLEQAELLDQASDYILVTRFTGELTFANRSAREAFGLTDAALHRRTFQQLMLFKDEQYDLIMSTFRVQSTWSGEIMFQNPEGKDRLCQCSLTLMKDDLDAPTTILAICSDISVKKEIEKSLMRAQRMETVGTLAGGIAHDLNNILGPIMVGIEILKRDAKDERSLKLLQTMESSAHRGARIVKQVLAFGRGLTSEKILVSPKHIVKEIIEMMKETFPKNIQVQSYIAPTIRNVNADPTQLHQVLLNLSVNARDAMSRGGLIKITAENFDVDESFAQLHKEAKAGSYIRFTVDDTGPGISPDVMDRIFEPFFTTKEVGKGTGLGLSTVQSIVQSHDGFIDVYSELGSGTSFKVYVPALLTETEVDSKVKQEDEYPQGNKETILVVDDEASVREIAASTLQSFNYNVLVASDGAEGLAVYSEHKDRINLILSDMMMPFLDGPAMIRALKKINPGVAVVGMSGLKTEDKEKLAQDLGVRYFIEKPYTANTLLKVLRQALTLPELS